MATPSTADATVTVPAELLDGTTQVLSGLVDVVKLDAPLREFEASAKASGNLHEVRAARELRAAWESAIAPGLNALAQLLPDEVGAISGRKAQMARDIMLGGGFMGAGVVDAGRKLTTALVGKVGVKRAGQLVVTTAQAMRRASGLAGRVVARVAGRGIVPVILTGAMAAGFKQCAKVMGLALGVLGALKLAGSKTGMAALREAAPWLLLGAGLLYLGKKGR